MRGYLRPIALLGVIACLLPWSSPALGGPASALPPTSIYAGTIDGAVYRSLDNGDTWQPTAGSLPTMTSVTALAVSHGGTNRLYVGTKSAGIYATSDGGKTWHPDNGSDSSLAQADIRGLATDPFDGSYVYAVSADGYAYSSSDGGLDWIKHILVSGSTPVSLGMSPEHRTTLFVGTTAGAQISTDGGYTWDAVDGIKANVTVYGFAFSSNDANVAYAATSDGVYAAFDGGQSWGPANKTQRGLDMRAVAVDPNDDTRIVAADATGGIYVSNDGGVTWNPAGGNGDASLDALAYEPDGNGIVGGATGGIGIYTSSDSGATWEKGAAFTAKPGDGITALSGTSHGHLPTDPVPPQPNTARLQYFPQSKHTVSGLFLQIYQEYGGLKIFGLPLTQPFDENGWKVQYFERIEFLMYTPSSVLLAYMGDSVTADRKFPTVPAFTSTATKMYFSDTHHSLSGRFLTYWMTHHGANSFGSPISEPFYEQNGDGSGRTYLVQYFDGARMEYHPELAGTQYEVSLGLLGQQVLRQRGWL